MFAFIKTSIHILAALCLGIVVALTALQDDLWFKDKLQQMLQQSFEEILKVPVQCQVAQVNILSGKIVIDSISVKSKTTQSSEQWALACPRMTFEFSLFGLLARHQIEADLTWYNVTASTQLDEKSLALVEPLKLIMQAPSIVPFELKKCSFKAAVLDLSNEKNNTYAQLFFSADCLFIDNRAKTVITYTNGTIKHQDCLYAQKIAGTVSADIATTDLYARMLKTQLTFEIPGYTQQPKPCSLIGVYKHTKGFLEFSTGDKKLSCKVHNISSSNGIIAADITAMADVAQLAAWAPQLCDKKSGIAGSASLESYVEIDVLKHTITYSGRGALEKARYSSGTLDRAQIAFKGNHMSASGTYEVTSLMGITGSGNWKAHLQDFTLQTDFMTTQPVALSSGVTIKPGEAHIKATLSKEGMLHADYTVRCSALKADQVHALSGTLKAYKNIITCTGTLDGYSYGLEGSLLPLKITVARCAYGHSKPVLEFKRNSHGDSLEGFVEYSFIKRAVHHFLGYELQGDGALGLNIEYDRGHIRGTIKLHKGTLRIPSVYNMVTDLTGRFNIDTRLHTIEVKDLNVGLHKGSAWSSRCAFYFDESSLLSAHIPLVVQNCLVSWNKEFFGLMSGSLSMSYVKEGASSLKGYIMLDDSHLRSNLLSSQVQKDFAGSAVKPLTAYTNDSTIDLSIDTRQPIHVKTPFLDAQARVQIKVKGSVFNPEVSGTINLSEGTLAFPYKPLYITQAKIFISPDSLDDARIELTAKNKIKKYMVTLQVTGSVGQPTISFESTPSLQEEQIITLLLAGSEEGSLSLVMPTMIMHNLEDLLFGPAESSSKLQRSFKTILKPLKHIRIIPTLADQKGDIRGAVEIDINDRLRATVQNNLTLSEDTQVEIEYTVSDDMSVRGIKDEQGNIGGEVEMRWKF
ncbi:translocation/assembly module TamB domain-containing protein [Candidatus Dependentiae bacterium]|nr:translocation/assembly module TamB domain-containing protein [Candidatus Dependentiae bacterium]